MYKVLSIDGGGIRGVIPAMILTHIENETGESIADLFDLVVGTSTGGIIAAGLTAPDAGGKSKFSAEQMLNLYTNRGREIFERSFWKGITSVGGILDEQYSADPLEEILAELLDDLKLSDCRRETVITSYDIEERKPYFFKSRHAHDKGRNHLMRDVARATSAAPTYFEPARIPDMNDPVNYRSLIDGGVFANNPAMCAYTEARNTGHASEDILVLSLGTGGTNRRIPYEDAKDWGQIDWIRPIIGVMMDGMSDSADFHMRLMLPDEEAGRNQRYFRFDIELTDGLDDLDAANGGNIRQLKEKAREILDNEKDEMRRLLAKIRPKPRGG